MFNNRQQGQGQGTKRNAQGKRFLARKYKGKAMPLHTPVVKAMSSELWRQCFSKVSSPAKASARKVRRQIPMSSQCASRVTPLLLRSRHIPPGLAKYEYHTVIIQLSGAGEGRIWEPTHKAGVLLLQCWGPTNTQYTWQGGCWAVVAWLNSLTNGGRVTSLLTAHRTWAGEEGLWVGSGHKAQAWAGLLGFGPGCVGQWVG